MWRRIFLLRSEGVNKPAAYSCFERRQRPSTITIPLALRQPRVLAQLTANVATDFPSEIRRRQQARSLQLLRKAPAALNDNDPSCSKAAKSTCSTYRECGDGFSF